MTRDVALIGVPSGAGACGVGQHGTPAALRAAGLVERLADAAGAVSDLGHSPPWPWRPDRTNRRAQNLGAVVEQVRTTATRVADGLAVPGRIALVLGGDCTIGIGTVAGAQSALGDVGLLYFDLHADLNTPASAGDGALDWMALAHMLAIPGSEPSLAEARVHASRSSARPGSCCSAMAGRRPPAGNGTRSSGSTWRVSRSKTLPLIPKRWRKTRLGCSRAAPTATWSISTSTSSTSRMPPSPNTPPATPGCRSV